MPSTQPEYGGRTHGRRVYPLKIMNENAGLLDIETAAFSKTNVDATTVNTTLTSPIQGTQVLPIGIGVLGGSAYVLKSAGTASYPTVPTSFAVAPLGNVDPRHASWTAAGVYVAYDELALGIVMHDLAGSPRDGVGGEDSELTANYYDGQGAYLDLFVYETHERNEYQSVGAGGDVRAQASIHVQNSTPLVYAAGDPLYIDCISGLLTNRKPKSIKFSIGAGTIDLSANFDPATHVVDIDDPADFDKTAILNAVHPTPVAEVIDVPTAEYRALRVKTLI